MSSKAGARWEVVGVSGVTCGGKTSFTKALHEALPAAVVINQDDYFLLPDDPRHVWVDHLSHQNWEIPSALDMEKFIADIKTILSRPVSKESLPLLIVEGFLIFTNPYISSVCHHKLFFTLDRTECWARRSVRTYDPPDKPGYFDEIVWPEYERHFQLALLINPDLTLLSGTCDLNILVKEIQEKLESPKSMRL